MFPGTYRIAWSQNRNLFVADIYVGWHKKFFYLILHDAGTGLVTQEPPHLRSYWFDELVQQPAISFADLYQDGQRQIVIQERFHSGNMYNAVHYRHFHIGPTLELVQILSYSTRSYGVWPPDHVPDDGDLDEYEGYLMMELEQLTPTRLRLTTFFEPENPGPRKLVGYMVLESPGPGKPFEETEDHIEPDYRRRLGGDKAR